MNEGIFKSLSEGQAGLQLVTGYECPTCYDTRLTAEAAACLDCHFQLFEHEPAAQQLAEAVVAREQAGLSLERDFHCARALVRATAQRPVRGTTLGVFLGVSEREVKRLIHTLRNSWHLPIGSLRAEPCGYYWMSTPEDCLAWFNVMKSQAMSELGTAYRLIKRHYPQLAGQLVINFEEEESQQ